MFIDTIHQISTNQDTNISGATIEKRKKRDKMIDITLMFLAIMQAYAYENDNHELKEKINYNKRKLANSRDTVVGVKCLLVLEHAQHNTAQLVDYGIKTADINKLKKAIDDYDETISNPRNEIVKRGTYTSQLKQQFKQTDALVKNLIDKLVYAFKETNTTFFTEYTKARIIVDL